MSLTDAIMLAAIIAFFVFLVAQLCKLTRTLSQLNCSAKERGHQLETVQERQELVREGFAQLADLRVQQTDVKARAEGSAAALGAVFSVLGIKRPLVISIPSLRETPIPDRCSDLSPYLDEQANARLEFIHALLLEHFKGQPFGEPSLETHLATFEAELAQGGTQPHIVMPQSPRDAEATQEWIDEERKRGILPKTQREE